jgi:hypothetical protein
VDILDTVNKPIRTTQRQRGVAWETFINIPGSIFKHQGYLFSLQSTRSSNEDFLPITDPLVKTLKKKLNFPFTVNQNQSYYFWLQWIPSTRFILVDGKQSIEFLDNSTLIPWWNGHMSHEKAFGVTDPTVYGYVSCGVFFNCDKLIILREL